MKLVSCSFGSVVKIWTAFVLVILASMTMMACSSCNQKPTHSAEEKGEMTVWAGSSLKEPLKEIAEIFEKEAGVVVLFKFSGSQELTEGLDFEEADVFIPVGGEYMEAANEDDEWVDRKSEKIIAYAIPALLVAKGNPKGITGLEQLATPGLKVAIANPKMAAVGLYGVQMLEAKGIADSVKTNLVPFKKNAEELRLALSKGEVDVIVGWKGMAKADANIEAIELTSADVPRGAVISMATTTFIQHKDESKKFYEFIQTDKAKDVFKKWGFLLSEDDAKKGVKELGGSYEIDGEWKSPK